MQINNLIKKLNFKGFNIAEMFFYILVVTFFILQSNLWFGEFGILANMQIKKEITENQAKIKVLKDSYNIILHKIEQLENNPELWEHLARSKLGMIKKNEILYLTKL